MATSSPFITTGQEAGLDDRQYIRRLRELLSDIPKPSDEIGTGLGTALRYQIQTTPVNDDDLLTITVNGVAQNIITTQTPAAGQVYIDFDTGRMIFGTPPPSTPANNISIVKNTVRWRDSTLKEALMGGVRMLWPKLGRVARDTSITLSTLQWDYDLPSIFLDKNLRITSVGVREIPASSEYFREIHNWQYVSGSGLLRIPVSQGYSPGATVEINYEAPYASLSEVEPKAQELPLWYAAGMLLGFKESNRVRTDNQNVMSEANANPPGAQQNAGSFFMKQFWQARAEIARTRTAVGFSTTYQRW